MNEPVLRAENLGKAYPLPKGEFRVFQGIDFELQRGDLAAIMGMSGVGKTTLLNLLGALDRPSEGVIWLDGEDLASRSDLEISGLRNRKIGFVFQFYHLLPEFTALENIAIPLLIRGTGRKEAMFRARKILAEVGLGDRSNFRPGQLSGGEQQRVAIARALVNDPKVLLADEPTGNLDWKTGEMVLNLILDLHQKKGLSSVIVTHNEKIASYCHKLYVMEAGELKLNSLSRR
jgi:ABC-type lipoprotein export system ATPase subunit